MFLLRGLQCCNAVFWLRRSRWASTAAVPCPWLLLEYRRKKEKGVMICLLQFREAWLSELTSVTLYLCEIGKVEGWMDGQQCLSVWAIGLMRCSLTAQQRATLQRRQECTAANHQVELSGINQAEH